MSVVIARMFPLSHPLGGGFHFKGRPAQQRGLTINNNPCGLFWFAQIPVTMSVVAGIKVKLACFNPAARFGSLAENLQGGLRQLVGVE